MQANAQIYESQVEVDAQGLLNKSSSQLINSMYMILRKTKFVLKGYLSTSNCSLAECSIRFKGPSVCLYRLRVAHQTFLSSLLVFDTLTNP